MKNKTTLAIAVALLAAMCSMNVFAQKNDPAFRKYMKTVYKLDDTQVENYVSLKQQFNESNSQLKDKRISSGKFQTEQLKLFDSFQSKVKRVFDKEQHFRWLTCNEKIDRYLILSEEHLVRRAKLRLIFKAESKWLADRKELREAEMDTAEQLEKEYILLDTLNASIRRIIPTDAEWYIGYKTLEQAALSNMDLYKVSFNEGFRIAEIDQSYSAKRRGILDKTGMKWADKELEMSELESRKKAEIASSLPADAAEKWNQVNNNRLNNVMARKYGLNTEQIHSYRTAFNKYAIEEYKILNERKDCSVSEKEVLLRQANEAFCTEVEPLFSKDKYREWRGWRQYTFKRRLKNKGIKYE